jgi:hypothetical protein
MRTFACVFVTYEVREYLAKIRVAESLKKSSLHAAYSGESAYDLASDMWINLGRNTDKYVTRKKNEDGYLI